jgi:hypothetical protein
MCIPMKTQKLQDTKEKISPKLYKILKDNGSKFISSDKCEIIDTEISDKEMQDVLENGWEPRKYRGDIPGGES